MVKYIPYKQLFIYYKSRKNEGVHMEINIGIIAIIVLALPSWPSWHPVM